jgi:hypothetical protein
MKIHELTDKQIRNNISDLYLDAVRLGEPASANWYRKAHDDCKVIANLYELPLEVFIGVVAALSPRMTWHYNIREAVRLIHGMRIRAYGANRAKALRILNGEKPLDVLGGNKVRSFYVNILSRGEDDSRVTIDVWALRVALGKHLEGQTGYVTDKQYHRLVSAYKDVAKKFGVLATELQAITWVHIKHLSRPVDGRQITLGLGV